MLFFCFFFSIFLFVFFFNSFSRERCRRKSLCFCSFSYINTFKPNLFEGQGGEEEGGATREEGARGRGGETPTVHDLGKSKGRENILILKRRLVEIHFAESCYALIR